MIVHQLRANHAGGRYALVTRTGSLTGETISVLEARKRDALEVQIPREVDGKTVIESRKIPFFVDWLSINQTHSNDLPLVDAGCVMSTDENGELQWHTAKSVQHEGSYETHLNVKCDGHRVTLSGNLSRFGRKDNLFGFGFWESLERANQVLEHYNLPPFDAGQRIEYLTKGQVTYGWTGARISRIDLTCNYESGSAENAHHVLQYLGEQHAGRKTGRVLGQGETVDWGGTGNGQTGTNGSRRQYWKAYIKHLQLERMGCDDERVIDHARERGIVRFEGTIRTRALSDVGAAYLGDYEKGWAMGQLINLFDKHTEVLGRVTNTTDDLNDLPKHLRATARDYIAGMDVKATLSRATFYKHRAALLPFGLDIAVRNVKPFTPRVRVIELAPANIPTWYELAA